MEIVVIGEGKFFQYISFRHSDQQAKLGSLHINDMNNIDVRYEFITKTDMEDSVTLNRKVGSLRDTILSVKHGNNPLFIGVE